MVKPETLLYPWFQGSEFEKYLTPKEREIVDNLGNLTYQRQQNAGIKLREQHIGELETQIGKLNFQPLTNPDDFGLTTVLKKYGFIFKLKYYPTVDGIDDVSLYGCIVREEVPFSNQHQNCFNHNFNLREKSPIHYGIISHHQVIGKEEVFWYLIDDSFDGEHRYGRIPRWITNYGQISKYDVSHFALLSKRHWKKMRKFLKSSIMSD